MADKLSTNLKIGPHDYHGVTTLLEEDFENFQAAQYLSERPGRGELTNQADPHAQEWIELEGSISIRRSVADVFAYISDLAKWSQWSPFIKEGRQLTPGPRQQGMEWQVISSLLGYELDQIMVFTQYIPNHLVEFRSVNGPVALVVRFSFMGDSLQTNLTYTNNINTTQLLRLTRPTLERISNGGLQSRLKRLKAILEAPNIVPSDFGVHLQ